MAFSFNPVNTYGRRTDDRIPLKQWCSSTNRVPVTETVLLAMVANTSCLVHTTWLSRPSDCCTIHTTQPSFLKQESWSGFSLHNTLLISNKESLTTEIFNRGGFWMKSVWNKKMMQSNLAIVGWFAGKQQEEKRRILVREYIWGVGSKEQGPACIVAKQARQACKDWKMHTYVFW